MMRLICNNRSSRPEVFCKKCVPRNFAKFTRKHLCQKLYLKRDSGTGVFLWILRNFYEHLFLQNTSGGCFCNKQHLRSIWSLFGEKVRQHWGWVKKSVAYKKRMYIFRTCKLCTYFATFSSISTDDFKQVYIRLTEQHPGQHFFNICFTWENWL